MIEDPETNVVIRRDGHVQSALALEDRVVPHHAVDRESLGADERLGRELVNVRGERLLHPPGRPRDQLVFRQAPPSARRISTGPTSARERTPSFFNTLSV